MKFGIIIIGNKKIPKINRDIQSQKAEEIMKNESFAVMNHEYINTGGNTMVSVFTVHDREANCTRYVVANEEGFSLQTVNTITGDYDGDIDDVRLGYWEWDTLVIDPSWDMHQFSEDEWELYKYCQFEFYKEDCKYFGTKYRISVEELPNELLHKLTAEYILWSKEEGVGCLTDGYDVYLDEGYIPLKATDTKELNDIKEFFEWYERLRYENAGEGAQYITVAVAGNSVKIPFHADSYDLLHSFLQEAIKNF